MRRTYDDVIAIHVTLKLYRLSSYKNISYLSIEIRIWDLELLTFVTCSFFLNSVGHDFLRQRFISEIKKIR